MVETKPQTNAVIDYVQDHFFKEYLEGIKEFVRIPSLSPKFDKAWKTNGNLVK
jgi:hypothetical protein